MKREFFARATRLALCAVGVALAAVLGFGEISTAHAQNAASSGDCGSWIDALTGKRVRTGPPGWSPITSGDSYAYGGHNFVLANGTWIDALTGKSVRTGPPGWSPITSGDSYAYGGHNFVFIPCPPPATTTTPATQSTQPYVPPGWHPVPMDTTPGPPPG